MWEDRGHSRIRISVQPAQPQLNIAKLGLASFCQRQARPERVLVRVEEDIFAVVFVVTISMPR